MCCCLSSVSCAFLWADGYLKMNNDPFVDCFWISEARKTVLMCHFMQLAHPNNLFYFKGIDLPEIEIVIIYSLSCFCSIWKTGRNFKEWFVVFQNLESDTIALCERLEIIFPFSELLTTVTGSLNQWVELEN